MYYVLVGNHSSANKAEATITMITFFTLVSTIGVDKIQIVTSVIEPKKMSPLL
jgi:hypothetical protein